MDIIIGLLIFVLLSIPNDVNAADMAELKSKYYFPRQTNFTNHFRATGTGTPDISSSNTNCNPIKSDHGHEQVKVQVGWDRNPDHFLVSPADVYPFKYTIASNDDDWKNCIQCDRPNWDVLSWHLNRYANKDKKQYLHCVDVGGNRGTFSIHMALQGCLVQTFEIQSNLVANAIFTFQLNELEHRIQVNQVGLSDAVSTMAIQGGEALAFIRPLSSAETKTTDANTRLVPVNTGDHCIHHHKHKALVKIDVEGFEIKALAGMKTLAASGSVEAFHIEIGPARWDRASLTTQQGFDILHEVLSKYHVHLIARREGTCPEAVYANVTSSDIALTYGNWIQHLSWPAMELVMKRMAAKEWDCNFFFSKQPISELVKENPIHEFSIKSLEGKLVRFDAKDKIANLVENGRLRAFPNSETFSAMGFEKANIVDTGLLFAIIPKGEPLPNKSKN